ncbi:hypothetical protein ACFOGI_02975 [Virgibacillus xinjiangensis]|uniref:Uncharacterized protein n=1 Tax=Virgibacillus xinjiangensis TaxID=393090 RepID=A0ABV7CSF7_9BACI
MFEDFSSVILLVVFLISVFIILRQNKSGSHAAVSVNEKYEAAEKEISEANRLRREQIQVNREILDELKEIKEKIDLK